MALIGDGAKLRDLQKGFAIIDSVGRKRFFILETYAEYEKWVSALSITLSLSNVAQVDSSEKAETVLIDNESDYEQINDDIRSDNMTQSSEEGLSYDGINDDLEGTKKLNLREKAKNRMSQIGTAVKKNVKIDKNAIKQLNSGAFRKPNTSSTNRLPENPSLKVKGLAHGTDAPITKEKIIHRDQKMCTIIENWIAKVSSIEPNIEGDQSSIASKAKVNIQLKCLQWKVNGHKRPSDILVKKDFSELMKFNAELSDALLVIRNDLTAAGLALMNTETMNLLFAQVLHSGRLLKGLLLYHKKESNVGLNDSICKFKIIACLCIQKMS